MRPKLLLELTKPFSSLNYRFRYCSTNITKSSEVCIVGGGMVGLYSALAFGKYRIVFSVIVISTDLYFWKYNRIRKQEEPAVLSEPIFSETNLDLNGRPTTK